MKEVNFSENNQPQIPSAFAEAFSNCWDGLINGSLLPESLTEIDKLVGEINRAFITQLLRRRDCIYNMNA